MSGGGGAGVMQAAIEVLRANKSLLQKRRGRSFRELRQMYIEEQKIDSYYGSQKLIIKKADKAVLESLRAKLRRERERDLMKQFLVVLITLAIGVAGLFWALKFL